MFSLGHPFLPLPSPRRGRSNDQVDTRIANTPRIGATPAVRLATHRDGGRVPRAATAVPHAAVATDAMDLHLQPARARKGAAEPPEPPPPTAATAVSDHPRGRGRGTRRARRQPARFLRGRHGAPAHGLRVRGPVPPLRHGQGLRRSRVRQGRGRRGC